MRGWYEFDKNGRYLHHKENKDKWSTGYPYRGVTSRSHISDHGYNQHTTCYDGRCGD
jgi:hypothetical protein